MDNVAEYLEDKLLLMAHVKLSFKVVILFYEARGQGSGGKQNPVSVGSINPVKLGDSRKIDEEFRRSNLEVLVSNFHLTLTTGLEMFRLIRLENNFGYKNPKIIGVYSIKSS